MAVRGLVLPMLGKVIQHVVHHQGGEITDQGYQKNLCNALVDLHTTPNRFKRHFRNSIRLVKHVLSNTRPPIRYSIKQIYIVLTQRNKVIASKNATKGLGDRKPKIITRRVETVRDLFVAICNELSQTVGGDSSKD